MEHFATFARLHQGGSGDLRALQIFAAGTAFGTVPDQLDWASLLDRDDVYVLIATECQLIVGVGVVEHARSGPEADLVWLYVSPDARGRGIGQLILSNLIGRARSEGAALLHAHVGARSHGVARALLQAGFTENGGGAWTFGLWNGYNATSYSNIVIPLHEPVQPAESAAQALLIAMGALDGAMLLTARARQTLSHELSQDAPELSMAGATALAAARRRYFVRVSSRLTDLLHGKAVPEVAERICPEDVFPTPERILGCLSRHHLCMVRLTIERLGRGPRWYLVAGFDGFLFNMHDVTRGLDGVPGVVTTFELRQATKSVLEDDFLILGKVL